MSVRVENLKILRCPLDSSELVLEKDSANIFNGYALEGKLICQDQNHRFHLKNGVPQLIPTPIRDQLEFERRKLSFRLSRGRRRFKLKEKSGRLSKEELYLVEQIQAMDKMALGYRRYVVDPLDLAPSSAIFYERYEDLLLRDIIGKNIARSKEDGVGVVFIEVGSGPGRYLIQYGGKIESDRHACKKYRAHTDIGRFYTYDKEYSDNLKLIIGIDFSEEMINSVFQWIRENGLEKLLYEDRIIIINAIAQHLSLSFDSTPYKDSHKVVTCAFQTLGNQLDRSLQVKMLRKMKEFAEPHGTIFVSVFNKNVFMEFLPKYYKKIEPSIGPIISSEKNHEKATLKTRWGVYSRWFDENELRDLFDAASKAPSFLKLSNVEIKSGDVLPLFPNDSDYLTIEDQKEIRKRAIIATVEL